MATPPRRPAGPGPGAADRTDTIERHPLELRALIEPETVLRELSSAIIDARLEGDQRQVALLYLAQANACRVVADWDCQREAGINARAAATEAGVPHLAVRGIIAESRARLAMQDYTRGARLLGDAELLLKDNPQAELLADVMLAYSSMSYALGKHPLAAEYAQRGLAVLGEDEGLAMRARLMRNRARAEAQLDQVEAANASLQQATRLAQRLKDPKLEAELYLEGARVARIVGDLAIQRRNGERVLAMAGPAAQLAARGPGPRSARPGGLRRRRRRRRPSASCVRPSSRSACSSCRATNCGCRANWCRCSCASTRVARTWRRCSSATWCWTTPSPRTNACRPPMISTRA